MSALSPYKESKLFIVWGLFMLVFGSGLLLLCKLPLPEFVDYLLALGGGLVLLLGNGCIIYGLLIFSGAREPTGDGQ